MADIDTIRCRLIEKESGLDSWNTSTYKSEDRVKHGIITLLNNMPEVVLERMKYKELRGGEKVYVEYADDSKLCEVQNGQPICNGIQTVGVDKSDFDDSINNRVIIGIEKFMSTGEIKVYRIENRLDRLIEESRMNNTNIDLVTLSRAIAKDFIETMNTNGTKDTRIKTYQIGKLNELDIQYEDDGADKVICCTSRDKESEEVCGIMSCYDSAEELEDTIIRLMSEIGEVQLEQLTYEELQEGQRVYAEYNKGCSAWTDVNRALMSNEIEVVGKNRLWLRGIKNGEVSHVVSQLKERMGVGALRLYKIEESQKAEKGVDIERMLKFMNSIAEEKLEEAEKENGHNESIRKYSQYEGMRQLIRAIAEKIESGEAE